MHFLINSWIRKGKENNYKGAVGKICLEQMAKVEKGLYLRYLYFVHVKFPEYNHGIELWMRMLLFFGDAR